MSIIRINHFFHISSFCIAICMFYPFSLQSQPFDSLTQAIQKWDEQRATDLKAENGWLNLVALEWLKPGSNSIGSGKDATIHFPKGKFPLLAGNLIWENNEVWYTPDPDVAVTDNGKPMMENKLLWSEKGENTSILGYESIRYTIIKRDARMGVRIRDLTSDAIKNFTGIERFPVKPEWVIKAKFVPEPGWRFRTIPIVNVLGQTIQMKTPGNLMITLGGQTYHLDAIEDGPNELLIVFGDATNDVSTYSSGRFLSMPLPGEGITDVWLDFNKAFNPPCAFTPFATCPLPPTQNQLRLPVEAGEKLYKNPAKR